MICPNCGNTMRKIKKMFSEEFYCEECGCRISDTKVSYNDCGDDDDE